MQAFSGKRLAQRREDAGMRHIHLACAVDLCVETIKRHERGSQPSADIVGRYAEALNCAVQDLFDDVES